MPETRRLVCARCDEPLVTRKTTFEYLGSEFSEELPRCPKCGQVYLDEELVRGKMFEVETLLEDK